MTVYLAEKENGHQSAGRIGGRFEPVFTLLHQLTPTAHRRPLLPVESGP